MKASAYRLSTRLTSFANALLLIVLLVSGCIPAIKKPAQPGDDQGANSTAGTAATIDHGDNGRSITIAIPEDPPSFNAIVGDTGYDGLVMNLVLLGLTGVKPDGEIYPELASELPTQENGGVVLNEATGAMDVFWKLRSDVQWADGKLVSADDVVFTWEAIINPETGIWVRGSDYVDSVEKIDDQTVVFHYNTIYPGYLTQLGGEQLGVWPAHYCDPEQGFTAWDCAHKPLSDGPFVLKEWVVGDYMRFERNPTYFEPGKPRIDEVIVRIIPDESVRKQMMIRGEVDLLMWATEQVVNDLQDIPNVKISLSENNRWVMRLFPNEAAKGSTDPVSEPHPILSDVRVRQAIRQAINVDTIVDQIFYGYARPIWTEMYREPYICDIPRPVYDPEAAKKILEEAGWKDTNGDGFRECTGCLNAKKGTPMRISFYTYSDYGDPLLLTQQLIADDLKQVGIDAQITIFEGNVMWTEKSAGGIEQSGDFDLDLWDDGYAGVDPTDFLYELYAASSATPGNGWNIVRWQNEEFNNLLREAYSLDEARRKEIFCEMAKILDKEAPILLLFSIINADAHSARLSGVQSNLNDLVTWNAADWEILP